MRVRTYLAMTLVMAGMGVNASDENRGIDGSSTLSNITVVELDVGSLDVSIMSTDENTVSWKLQGSSQELIHQVKDGKLYLTKRKSALPSLKVIASNAKSNLSFIRIDGLTNTSTKQKTTTCEGRCAAPHLELYIPRGAAINFNAYKGFATVESIKGRLNVQGSGTIKIGSLGYSSLHLEGNAKVLVGIVSGSISGNLKGNSSLYIHAGYIPEADLILAGNSTFKFTGDVHKLAVHGSGNSRVDIGYAHTTNRIRTSGNAEICVKSLNDISKNCS